MKIAVLGAGGVGGLFGARLAASGSDITFIARGKHLEAIAQERAYVSSALWVTSQYKIRRLSTAWTRSKKPTSSWSP